jgi:3-oxoacyl-[acyl-carrier-protein] synthase III
MSGSGFGIASVGHYLPKEVRTVEFWAQTISAAPALVAGLHQSGARQFHIAAEDETVLEMALKAAAHLFERCTVDPKSIDLILFTHTLPFSVPPPPLSVSDAVRDRFACSEAAGFSLAQQNCGSLFGIFYLVRDLLQAEPDLNSVLILTADKVIDEYSRNIRDELILSDAASAVLLRRNEAFNRVTAMSHFGDARYRPLPGMRNELGRNCTVYHSKTARKAIELAGVRPQDIEAALTINERPATGRGVLQMCQVPLDRLFSDNVSRIGHAFQSDFAINLQDCLARAQAPLKHCLAFMNGDNGTFYSVILEDVRRTWS